MRDDRATPRHASDGGGRARLIGGPNPIEVGVAGEWTLALEVGPLGIAEGGSIVFQAPPFWGWSPAQAERPEWPGFTAFSAPAALEIRTFAREGMASATVRGRALRPGEEVTITYAGVADRFAERESALWVAVDGD